MRRRVSSAAVTTRARDAASSARLSAFAIAVATSSVNSDMRPSTPSGRGRSRAHSVIITPQRRPPTKIGVPSVECIEAGRPVDMISSVRLPTGGVKPPAAGPSTFGPVHVASRVTSPSGS